MRKRLENVRLSFAHLYKARPSDDDKPGKFGASFLIAKSDPQIKGFKRAIVGVAKEKWPSRNNLKGIDICLHDGAEKDFDGYSDEVYYITSSSAYKPMCFDQRRNALSESDGKPYSGCYVNAIIELWAQDNKFGKKVNAELKGIQFVRDGDPFGGGKAATADEFDDVENMEDDEDEDEDGMPW